MTYKSSGLSAISYANGFTLWHYRTDDDAASVFAPDYFNDAHKMLRTGDFLFVNTSVNDAPRHFMAVVVENADKSVAVCQMTAWGGAS